MNTRRRPSRARQALLAALTVAGSLALTAIFAEVALRFLPVHSGLPSVPVNDAQPYYRYAADRNFVYSNGWRLLGSHRGRLNDLGFVNAQDYLEAGEGPVLAVVGDSYVEAQIVPYPLTLHGRLAARVGDRGRVMSFGASGAPLSQYLAWAELARDRFQPELLVVLIVGNDYDESYFEANGKTGFHYFREGADGRLELYRVDHARPVWKDAVLHSALARYLMLNVGLQSRITLIAQGLRGAAGGAPRRYVGNTSAALDPERLARSERALARFLELLPEKSGLPPARVVLLLDGIRPALYEGEAPLAEAEQSFFGHMRRATLREARARGFVAIDLQPRFLARHAETGERFEHPHDAHWSGIGHGVAADAVAETPIYRRVFGAPASAKRQRAWRSTGARPTSAHRSSSRPNSG